MLGAAGILTALGPEATPETVYDLASVTKPFTAVAAARLARCGRLPLPTPIGELVAETRGTDLATTSIETLLAHRAGLLPHVQIFLPRLAGQAVDLEAALGEIARSRRPGCEGEPPPEGFPPVYSDLGYLLVGEAIRRCEGVPLDTVVQREIGAFTGSRVCAGRDLGDLQNVAPTEYAGFRGGVVHGAVHDENAWALGEGEMWGHAGLFGTSPDVVRFGAAILAALAGDRDDWLTAQEMEPLVRSRPGGTLRAGFDGKSAGVSAAGALSGARTFGHLGFTGTSLWMDPDSGITTVLLTNRVHPTRDNVAIRAARPEVHDRITWWWSDVHETLGCEVP